ncbi:MAG TPA: hypothetical protein VF657_08035 [Actinoplanes sp.]|jgi:hypothetical protein
MRRAILAATLGGVLLTGAACDSDAETPTAAPPPAAATTPSTAPTTPPPDYSADTRKVCGRIDRVFGTGIKTFGTEVGRMIAYKEAKVPAEAKKSQKAAGARLKAVAADIRKETSVARDPALKTAGKTSAAKFSRAAADSRFFNSIKTQKDFDRTIQSRLSEWQSPLSGYCA